MCRFLAYKGAALTMDKLLFAPENSLIKQSYDAKEIEEPLNGDGFGVGWYAHDIEDEPAVFVSVSPAWSNRNLAYMAPKIRAHCILAHVRAASFGGTAEDNCHPFHFEDYLFMHNGDIGGFDRIKRNLRHGLSDEAYQWIRGQTDSEHFFALMIDYLPKGKRPTNAKIIAAAMRKAILRIAELKAEFEVTDPTYLNLVVTNGHALVALRYVSDSNVEPLTLYYSTGARYECRDGCSHMVPTPHTHEHAVIVVSEKLTEIESDWHAVPPGHMLLVSDSAHVSLEKAT